MDLLTSFIMDVPQWRDKFGYYDFKKFVESHYIKDEAVIEHVKTLFKSWIAHFAKLNTITSERNAIDAMEAICNGFTTPSFIYEKLLAAKLTFFLFYLDDMQLIDTARFSIFIEKYKQYTSDYEPDFLDVEYFRSTIIEITLLLDPHCRSMFTTYLYQWFDSAIFETTEEHKKQNFEERMVFKLIVSSMNIFFWTANIWIGNVNMSIIRDEILEISLNCFNRVTAYWNDLYCTAKELQQNEHSSLLVSADITLPKLEDKIKKIISIVWSDLNKAVEAKQTELNASERLLLTESLNQSCGMFLWQETTTRYSNLDLVYKSLF